MSSYTRIQQVADEKKFFIYRFTLSQPSTGDKQSDTLLSTEDVSYEYTTNPEAMS
jgi:hypothetical protein